MVIKYRVGKYLISDDVILGINIKGYLEVGIKVFVYKEIEKMFNLIIIKGVLGSWVLKIEVNIGKR